jgi:amidase
MSSHGDWEALVADKRRRQNESIPSKWRITLPDKDVLNITDIPRSCGLLTSAELEITETTDVDILLKKLASGTWTSVQVTTAFYKRAIIAHQLVNSSSSWRFPPS